jgi:hypothetical protein
MPAFEVMFPKLVVAVQDDETIAQVREMLEGGASLPEIIDALDLVEHDGQREFIESTPASMQAAILAVVRENLGRDEPKQMMFTWAPAYDWEMNLWESTASNVSAGGITVQMRSRYPGDPHPGIAGT